MPDESVTFSTLVRYHREILAPDFERMLGGLEERIDRRFQGHLDEIDQRFDRLETEYQMLLSGVRRLEERMDSIVALQEKAVLRSELQQLQARVDALQAQIHQVEKRLEG